MLDAFFAAQTFVERESLEGRGHSINISVDNAKAFDSVQYHKMLQ